MATKKAWWTALPLLALALLAGSCNGLQDNPNDCDYVLSAGLTVPQPGECPAGVDLFTDALCDDYVLMCFTVTVDLAQIVDPLDPTAHDNFKLASYDVAYVNSATGRSVPGVDVPRPFTFTLPFQPQMVPGVQSILSAPLLNLVQKSESPLNNPAFYPANGAGVDLLAVITVDGYPIGDTGQNCTASFQQSITVTRDGTNCP